MYFGNKLPDYKNDSAAKQKLKQKHVSCKRSMERKTINEPNYNFEAFCTSQSVFECATVLQLTSLISNMIGLSKRWIA